MFPRDFHLIGLTMLLVLSFQSFCFAYQGINSPSRHSRQFRQNFLFPRSLFIRPDDQIEEIPLPPKLEWKGDDDDIIRDLATISEQEAEDNDVSNTESSPKIKRMNLKRMKGPTLSVVNPLEILRQRLMLDLARRRIHQNEKQIVANSELLENLGKRSGNFDGNYFQFQNPKKSEIESFISDGRSEVFKR